MRLRSRSAALLALIAIATAAVHISADQSGRVVLISIDGMMPSRYTAEAPAKIPNIRQLMARGVHAEGVVGIMPTVTYPSHTTLMTGVRPAVHGIFDNRILDPEGRSNAAWYWYARSIKVPTLPMAARSRGLRAAAISWPATVGMDLDYLVPEFWRSNHPETLTLLRALSRPQDLIDTVEIDSGKPIEWPTTDRDRTNMAKFILRTYQPHVLMLHLLELDSAEHDHGPASDEALATLEQLDAYVGEIVQTLEATGLAASTTVAVASDHGFLKIEQQLQPNAAFMRERLITVDDRGTVTDWRTWFHSSGGSGFVYLKDPSDAALRDRVLGILKSIQSDRANGVRRIWDRAELDQLGAHPDAAFGLDVQDGFYTSSAHDLLVKPTTGMGGHGFDPSRPELRASLVLAGPAVSRRGSLGVIRMTQIAPTLAGILGVGLSPQADRGVEIHVNR